jgi:MtN3 and saliva related transmembrane protein
MDKYTGMDLAPFIGYVAGICSTLAFVPQVYRTYRTRHAYDISYGMLLLLSTGVCLWFIYGLSIHDIPIILANGVTLMLLLFLTGMKVSFTRRH